VAVTLRCDGCITVYTETAIKHGTTKEEIAEGLGVAVTVVNTARAIDAFKEYPRAALPCE
jgi:AhpD family alkylhydroperoxidase